jgi:DNA-binding MarR family transcriptional regulator
VAKAGQNGDDALLLDWLVCFPLYAATDLLNRLYAPVLGEIGLTYPHYPIMLVLWEPGVQTAGALGSHPYLDSGTLSPLLKRMEAAGLITHQRDPARRMASLHHFARSGARCVIRSILNAESGGS